MKTNIKTPSKNPIIQNKRGLSWAKLNLKMKLGLEVVDEVENGVELGNKRRNFI